MNIKLRAWLIEDKIMLGVDECDYAYMSIDEDGKVVVIFEELINKIVDGEHDQHYEWVEMPSDAYEIIEFTDLYDSNEMEIWEGDIFQVEYCYDSFGTMAGEKREVYFTGGGFRLKPDNPEKASGHWLDSDVRGVVIGNVYQNPELI